MLQEILNYFDKIQVTDGQVSELVDHIEEYEEQEQALIKNAQRLLNEKLNLTQDRISKLIDMHIDGKINAETYHYKLEEYKREQQSLVFELKSYNTDSKVELVAAKEVFELVQEAKEFFASSKLDEKQQLLGFFFSNLTLDTEKIDLELREPFKMIANAQERHIWRQTCGTLRIFRWSKLKQEISSLTAQSPFFTQKKHSQTYGQ